MTTLELTYSLELALAALEQIAQDRRTIPPNRERALTALGIAVAPGDLRRTSAARVSALCAPRL